jgi:uncharacterized protein (TIGR02246 family)
LWLLAVAGMAFGVTAWPGLAQQPKGDPKDKAALAKKAEAFVEAFHKADAKALAAFWAPDGDYTDQTGRHLKGRDAIEKAFKGFFSKNKGLKLRIDSDSLQFVTPDVAIEDGMTTVIPSDGGPPSRARYTIVHVKKSGQWYLNSVRDAPFSPPSNYEHLRGLEWTIGDWIGNTDTGEVERLSFAWTESQNFIVSSFTTTAKNVSVGGATVWTGWDPVAKNMRSWIFDATGGFGEGSWAQDGKKWALKTTSVLQDGKKAAATYVLTRVDGDTITLQARDRSVDGKSVPDTKEVKMKRAK